MANPTLNWTINKERGTISFGRLLPLTGNTYNLTIAGGTTGESYTFYVMDESGEVCLAKSSTTAGVTTIAFNTKDLRDQFSKDWHETRTFHCTCSNGTATIAESDIEITWNPLWTDASTGESYSMRGPQGVGISAIEFARTDSFGNFVYQVRLSNGSIEEFVAPIGPQGIPANANYAYNSDTQLWHKIKVYTNRFGESVIELEQTGTANPPAGDYVVLITGAQTISGVKTFVDVIKAQDGIQGDITGNASTADKLKTARKFTITDNDGTHSQESTDSFDGSSPVTLKLPSSIKAAITGNVTGNVSGDLTGAVEIPSGKRILVSGTLAVGGAISCAGPASFYGGDVGITAELNASNIKDATIGLTIANQADKAAMSEKTFFDAIAILGKYFDGSWRFCPEATITEGYCGNTEATHTQTDQQNWKTIGVSGDHGQRGVFGFRTTTIEKYAFYSPYYLKKVDFPNLVTIGDYAFFNPHELVEISLPSVETIGAYAFHDCNILNGVNLPKCKNIGAYAFYEGFTTGTDGALEIRIGENATLGTAGNYNTIGEHAFAYPTASKVGKIICPNTQVFGNYAFSNGVNAGYYNNVTEFDIHNAVTIGNYAFCWLNYGRNDSAHQFDLNLPNCLTIGRAAFGTEHGSYSIATFKSLTAPVLTSLGMYAFYYNTALTSVNCVLLNTIGDEAFRYCNHLDTFTAPSVATIGSSAFYGCTALTSLSFPSIVSIGATAFTGCRNLMSLSLTGKTTTEVTNMPSYPWGLPTGCVITCSNGTITIS